MEECQTTASVRPSKLRMLRWKTPKVKSFRQQKTSQSLLFPENNSLGKELYSLFTWKNIMKGRFSLDYNLSVQGI